MDAVTHAGIGLIAASPFLPDRPELALGIVAGSVLPDLDALWRLGNKTAFLRAHQTWSHALPVQLLFSILTGCLASLAGWKGLRLGGGVFAGLMGHSLLDLTNTYGVAWLLPFSRRRFCLEWVFFIDLITLLNLGITLALVIPAWLRGVTVPGIYAAAFFAFLTPYIFAKGLLRRRAGVLCSRTKSLVPSALVPWRFYGTEPQQNTISFFRVNAFTGARSTIGEVHMLDKDFAKTLNDVPEFRLMRELSPEYHVVAASNEGAEMRVLCRDMRLRNFGTRFGDLEVWLDSGRHIVRSRFHA